MCCQVPADLLRRCESADELCPPAPLSPVCTHREPESSSFSARLHAEYKSRITNRVQLLLMDTSSKRSGWRVYKAGEGMEVSYRATHDSLIPLWRAITSVHATQESLLKRILEERWEHI